MAGTKHIFITGGVVSSVGKGITAACLARLLKNRGYSVTIHKLDPYINVDPGTMNPYQHGEVFVTEDGAETDLDVGHYERFIDQPLSREHNATTGQIYLSVIERERMGSYQGGTVQVVPHITNEIKERIRAVARRTKAEIVLTEIGGTVGDMESMPFLEAVRQLRWELGPDSILLHLSLLPYLSCSGEVKSKPTQHSIKELQGIGLTPDIVVCRSTASVPRDVLDKIARFANLDEEFVIENTNAKTLYAIPLMLEENGLGRAVCKKLGLEDRPSNLQEWEAMVSRQLHPKKKCSIGIVGKYIQLHDAYLSVVESLVHGGIAAQAEVDIKWIQSSDLEEGDVEALLGGLDGILVPGGFGERGIEGKILAAKYARTHGIPYFGICLGMQMAVIEYARNVLELSYAHTTEIHPETPHPVIALMPDQENVTHLGGTQRLGGYKCRLADGSISRALYSQEEITERHRHRYEFNNDYMQRFEKSGMRLAGINPERGLVEIVELPNHPWYVGVQFHPEFKSRPNSPHPLFAGFVEASCKYAAQK